MNAPDPVLSLDPLTSLERAAALALDHGPDTPTPNPDDPDPNLTTQVEQVNGCLRLLEQVWHQDDSQPDSQTGIHFPTRPDRGLADDFEPPFRLSGFEILQEISRGGMGIVYRARQLSLDRAVALKRLPPAYAADPERLERFHTEAAAVARLQDFGVLPLHDILHVADTPVLVMPFIDGPDLGRVLTERQALRDGQEVPEPHSLATADENTYLQRVLAILDRLIDAVAATHAAGILHRDVKPSNVLLDGKDNAWLSDFGLAQLRDNPRITKPGEWMGTPGFISPEQWAGRDDLDARADVFSLGATIYQALTLELPYDNARLQADAEPPPPPSSLQSLLTADFDAVLLKALEPDRTHRYSSVAEFKEDWQRVRQGLPPKARRLGPARRLFRKAKRNPWKVAACFLAVVLLGVLGFFFPRPAAPGTADQTVYRTVKITTQPSGARVVLVPFNQYEELDPDKRIRPPKGQVTPLTLERVPVGKYLVVAEVPGYGFHEVYRTIPDQRMRGTESDYRLKWKLTKDGTIELFPIRIVPNAKAQEAMALFCGGELILDDGFSLRKKTFLRQVDPFYLDTTEVTVRAYKKVMKEIPDGMRKDFPQPPLDFNDYAVRSVDFYSALNYAELVGKRLPTQFEYEYAATKGSTQRFPWGNDEKSGEWVFGPVKHPSYDCTNTDPPVYGLYSNVAEWTDSLNWNYDPSFHPSVKKYDTDYLRRIYDCRVVRGAPSFIIWGRPSQKGDERTLKLGPRWHQAEKREKGFATIGFRCARSAGPRFLD